MIIYSANIGVKDRLLDPHVVFPEVEYVYFVDDKSKYESEVWDIREVPRRFDTPRTDSKWYKMHPHLLFPGENTVWTDGNYRPNRKDPTELFTESIVLFRHVTRSCLYDEADVCIDRKAASITDISKQVKAYRDRDMPAGFGLYQGNVLIRRPEAAAFNEAWWKETQRQSSRDQISMPYILWRDNIQYTSLSHKQKKPYFMKTGKHLLHGVNT
jgi:hypothetical protein